MSNSRESITLNRTKLYRPPVTADLVLRNELISRLDAGFTLPLTLIAAPAGYGKSTLVSDCFDKCSRPGAWLSLDKSDSDIRVFVTYLVEALRTLSPGCCKDTINLVRAETLPPFDLLAAHFANDLEELEQRSALVLDDYHLIENLDIHDFLDHLLKHPSPKLHLVVLSRRDPPLSLVKMRATRGLTELRMQDLRFTNEQVLQFLNQVADGKLQMQHIARLSSRTEGWPVGIRLAALALHHQTDMVGYLAGFDIDERPLQAYLVSEVLSAQTDVIQKCMLYTSILGRFQASLCEAVWGHDIGDEADQPPSGQDFFKALEVSGLFTISLDTKHSWLRFHHMFGDLLRQRLEDICSKDQINSLHIRASDWFEAHGYHDEAIRHALTGADVERAAAIVGQARHECMSHDDWFQLERWLSLFSQDSVQRTPQLLLMRCWLDLCHWYRLDRLVPDMEQTGKLLEMPSLDSGTAESLKIELNALHSAISYWTIELEQAMSQSKTALTEASGQSEYVKSHALMYLCVSYQAAGNINMGETILLEQLDQGRMSYVESEARLLQALCWAYWCEAESDKLHLTASRLLQVSLENDLVWSQSFARYFLGLLCYERNQLDEAILQLEIVAHDAYRHPIQNITHCSVILALCYHAQGLPERARDLMERTSQIASERGNRQFMTLMSAFQAELDLRQERKIQAKHWAANYGVPALHAYHRFYNPELTYCRILLDEAVNNDKHAAHQLCQLEETLAKSSNKRLLIDLMGMKALLAEAKGEKETAKSYLQKAVALGQPGGLVRPLADLGPGIVRLLNGLDLDREGLEYAGTVLSALGNTNGDTVATRVDGVISESLSERELEILNLIADNLSNREIANNLYISTGTVKRHAHNIFGKLSVGSRRDAVAKARGLGILNAG